MNELFKQKMEKLLGAEFNEFVDASSNEISKSFRVNTSKISNNELLEGLTSLYGDTNVFDNIPWCPTGYYLTNGDITLGKTPYYHAGAYYIQEASAMIPVEVLDPKPGELVLDLCAAPGGKSVQIASKLNQDGFVLSNDISPKRTKALAKNLQMAGFRNIAVANASPEQLADHFPCYFDKVLVDAPCSGEGMFKKDKQAAKNWTPEYVIECQSLQRQILISAVKMLKPGGLLVYSTCTFSPEEDESHIEFLSNHCPEMSLEKLNAQNGLTSGLNGESVLRAWPHKLKGTGHFIAAYSKSDSSSTNVKSSVSNSSVAPPETFVDFFGSLPDWLNNGSYCNIKDQLYWLPSGINLPRSVRFELSGLHLGTMKKNRFVPAQALAMALSKNDFREVISLDISDPLVLKYLKGETINLKAPKGWLLICMNDLPLGWAKSDGNFIKNYYNPNWRMN
ncbi:MAG: RsmB/NOP family class I SAM-dependent RNA methyltransferase [Tissierellales bacterium]|jgi:NOL1/NOP2/sun family putative RNA methylase|nr:RsmB/NOP family class I SAM-dependent RNA methyltransferase [Tissierellales bacterium]